MPLPSYASRPSTFLLAVLLAGCPETPVPGDAPGELGHGTFTYSCTSTSDALCASTCTSDTCTENALPQRASTFPTTLALGATFRLDYTGAGETSGVTSRFLVVAADPAAVALTKGNFAMIEGGAYAFLAEDVDGSVGDLIHVDAAAIARLAVRDDLGEEEAVALQVGDTAVLRTEPRDVRERVLAGTLAYTWTSADEAVVTVAKGQTNATAELHAEGVGKTTVHIGTGAAGVDLDVTVGAP